MATVRDATGCVADSVTKISRPVPIAAPESATLRIVDPCELRCIHSRCPGKCGEHCVPCAEQCTWACEHRGRCHMPCGAPCDRLPCSLRCAKFLECGHQCPSICGEVCPGKGFCQHCCTPNLRETVVEFLELTSYEETNLDIQYAARERSHHQNQLSRWRMKMDDIFTIYN